MFAETLPEGSPQSIVPLVLLSAAVGAGAWFDLRYRRIPNWLSAITAIAGIALTFWIVPSSAGSHLLHMVIALVVGMLLFHFRVFGGGDAKFYSAIAVWFSLSDAVKLLFAVSLCGLGLLLVWFTIRRLARLPISKDSQGMSSLPYAVAIGGGALVAALL